MSAEPANSNVVAFPLPSARQALLLALKPHMHSGALLIPFLHECGLENYPDPAVRIVATHLEYCHQHHQPVVPWHTTTPRLIVANDLKWLLICSDALLPPAVPVYYDSSGGLVLRQPNSPELEFVAPRDRQRAMVEVIERYRDVLNAWEQKFFTSIRYRRTLSEKQTAVFNGLFEHAVATHCERCQERER